MLEKGLDKENRNINHVPLFVKKSKNRGEDPLDEIRKLLKEVRVDMGKYSKSLKVKIRDNHRKPTTTSKRSTRTSRKSGTGKCDQYGRLESEDH